MSVFCDLSVEIESIRNNIGLIKKNSITDKFISDLKRYDVKDDRRQVMILNRNNLTKIIIYIKLSIKDKKIKLKIKKLPEDDKFLALLNDYQNFKMAREWVDNDGIIIYSRNFNGDDVKWKK